MHVAFSEEFKGVGIFAGGPYWCNQDNEEQNINFCQTDPKGIKLDFLEKSSTIFENMDWISKTKHITNSKVWLFSGMLDKIIVPGVVDKTEEFYKHFGADISYVNKM